MLTINHLSKINKLSKYNNKNILQRKLIEETSELVAALSQYADDKIASRDLITEIADVIIVGQQLLAMRGFITDELSENKGFKYFNEEDKMCSLINKLNIIIEQKFTDEYSILYLCLEAKGILEYLCTVNPNTEQVFEEEIEYKTNRQFSRLS